MRHGRRRNSTESWPLHEATETSFDQGENTHKCQAEKQQMGTDPCVFSRNCSINPDKVKLQVLDFRRDLPALLPITTQRCFGIRYFSLVDERGSANVLIEELITIVGQCPGISASSESNCREQSRTLMVTQHPLWAFAAQFKPSKWPQGRPFKKRFGLLKSSAKISER